MYKSEKKIRRFESNKNMQYCTVYSTPYRVEPIPPGLDERVEPVQGVADGEGGVRDSHQQAAATAYCTSELWW